MGLKNILIMIITIKAILTIEFAIANNKTISEKAIDKITKMRKISDAPNHSQPLRVFSQFNHLNRIIIRISFHPSKISLSITKFKLLKTAA